MDFNFRELQISGQQRGDGGFDSQIVQPTRRKDNYLLHIGLFVATFISVSYTSLVFTNVPVDTWEDLLANFHHGIPYSLLLLF